MVQDTQSFATSTIGGIPTYPTSTSFGPTVADSSFIPEYDPSIEKTDDVSSVLLANSGSEGQSSQLNAHQSSPLRDTAPATPLTHNDHNSVVEDVVDVIMHEYSEPSVISQSSSSTSAVQSYQSNPQPLGPNDGLRGIITPEWLTTTSSVVINKLVHELHDEDQTIKWLKSLDPTTKKGAHHVAEDVTGQNIENAGATKILKKRPAHLPGVSEASINLPTQVTTAHDQVITTLHNVEHGTVVPIDSFQANNIRTSTANPHWDPIGVSVGQQSLPAPSFSPSEPSATGIQSAAPDDTYSVCVRTNSSLSNGQLTSSTPAPTSGTHVVMTAVLAGMAMVSATSPLPKSILTSTRGRDADEWMHAALRN